MSICPSTASPDTTTPCTLKTCSSTQTRQYGRSCAIRGSPCSSLHPHHVEDLRDSADFGVTQCRSESTTGYFHSPRCLAVVTEGVHAHNRRLPSLQTRSSVGDRPLTKRQSGKVPSGEITAKSDWLPPSLPIAAQPYPSDEAFNDHGSGPGSLQRWQNTTGRPSACAGQRAAQFRSAPDRS
jgi:hypothetical protein